MKLRDWINNIPFIAGSFNETKIYFYDQDPWEAYHDNCVARNAYKYVFSMINVEKFLVTSSWWSKFIQKKDNLPVSFVRMGIYQAYATKDPQYLKENMNLVSKEHYTNIEMIFLKG